MTFIRKTLALTVLSILLIASSTEGATLHTVLVGDSLDKQLGDGFSTSVTSMHKELAKVANFAGMEFKSKILLGRKTTISNVINALESLNVGENDTLFLYMTMHGYRTPSKDEISHWPNLFFGQERNGGDFSFFLNEALKKNPRLLIVYTDSCNSYFPENAVPTRMALQSLYVMHDDTLRILNARRLFLESEGVILITSSTPGQYSWGSQAIGGVMTQEFIKELNFGLTSHELYSWDELLQNIFIKMIQLYEEKYLPEEQTPIYEIYLACLSIMDR